LAIKTSQIDTKSGSIKNFHIVGTTDLWYIERRNRTGGPKIRITKTKAAGHGSVESGVAIDNTKKVKYSVLKTKKEVLILLFNVFLYVKLFLDLVRRAYTTDENYPTFFHLGMRG